MSSEELVEGGIYRIIVAKFGARPDLLTRYERKGVTLLPPSEAPVPEQEWQIYPGKDGNKIIQVPSKIFPSSYLSFAGDANDPKEGDRIEVFGPFDFPHNEWHIRIAPGRRYYIHAAGSDLGIKISPPDVEPPILVLGGEGQLEWVFQRVVKE